MEQLTQDQSAQYAKEVVDANPDAVTQYKAGKIVIGPLLSQVMAKSRGSCNPKLAVEALMKELSTR